MCISVSETPIQERNSIKSIAKSAYPMPDYSELFTKKFI